MTTTNTEPVSDSYSGVFESVKSDEVVAYLIKTHLDTPRKLVSKLTTHISYRYAVKAPDAKKLAKSLLKGRSVEGVLRSSRLSGSLAERVITVESEVPNLLLDLDDTQCDWESPCVDVIPRRLIYTRQLQLLLLRFPKTSIHGDGAICVER